MPSRGILTQVANRCFFLVILEEVPIWPISLKRCHNSAAEPCQKPLVGGGFETPLGSRHYAPNVPRGLWILYSRVQFSHNSLRGGLLCPLKGPLSSIAHSHNCVLAPDFATEWRRDTTYQRGLVAGCNCKPFPKIRAAVACGCSHNKSAALAQLKS